MLLISERTQHLPYMYALALLFLYRFPQGDSSGILQGSSENLLYLGLLQGFGLVSGEATCGFEAVILLIDLG